MSSEERDVGPDPVWGMWIFIVGLLVMATGGAATWHWVFNVGEGMLLLGVAVFLIAVAITSHRKEPVGQRIRRAIRGDAQEAEAALRAPRRKKKKKA